MNTEVFMSHNLFDARKEPFFINQAIQIIDRAASLPHSYVVFNDNVSRALPYSKLEIEDALMKAHPIFIRTFKSLAKYAARERVKLYLQATPRGGYMQYTDHVIDLLTHIDEANVMLSSVDEYIPDQTKHMHVSRTYLDANRETLSAISQRTGIPIAHLPNFEDTCTIELENLITFEFENANATEALVELPAVTVTATATATVTVTIAEPMTKTDAVDAVNIDTVAISSTPNNTASIRDAWKLKQKQNIKQRMEHVQQVQ